MMALQVEGGNATARATSVLTESEPKLQILLLARFKFFS
jgi:hypothetical protein